MTARNKTTRFIRRCSSSPMHLLHSDYRKCSATDTLLSTISFPRHNVAVTLASGTLAGAFYGRSQSVLASTNQERPHGTVLTFRFPIASDVWLYKTFLFA